MIVGIYLPKGMGICPAEVVRCAYEEWVKAGKPDYHPPYGIFGGNKYLYHTTVEFKVEKIPPEISMNRIVWWYFLERLGIKGRWI